MAFRPLVLSPTKLRGKNTTGGIRKPFAQNIFPIADGSDSESA